MMRLSAILCFLFNFVLSERQIGVVRPDDCGSSAIFNEIYATGCSDISCTWLKGENVTITIPFQAQGYHDNLKVTSYAVIASVENPWSGLDEDACKYFVFGECPIETQGDYGYTISFQIPEEFPEIELVSKWVFEDEFEQVVICLQVPASIQTPTPTTTESS